MTTHDRVDQEDGAGIGSMATAPGGVLDLLRVAAVALDVEGRIALWSPEAEQLFGYRAAEALGRRADKRWSTRRTGARLKKGRHSTHPHR
ncbi:hypothetical protein SANTM175S_05948 [Streptomyces antimycoticus]